ncbi:UTRA domain-containing protein [Microbacterium sp. Se63.02b]|nr:UTRA domain-containing protein [Microbacterium sp. Se63.02b]
MGGRGRRTRITRRHGFRAGARARRRLPHRRARHQLPAVALRRGAPDLRDPRASLYAAIRNVAGVRIARMHRTIEAVAADRVLAALLEVEPGHPIVVVEAVAYDQAGQPIDFSRASVRTDRLRVSVDTGFDAAGISTETASGRYPTALR